jgi:hypothetical protein
LDTNRPVIEDCHGVLTPMYPSNLAHEQLRMSSPNLVDAVRRQKSLSARCDRCQVCERNGADGAHSFKSDTSVTKSATVHTASWTRSNHRRFEEDLIFVTCPGAPSGEPDLRRIQQSTASKWRAILSRRTDITPGRGCEQSGASRNKP